ncbi:hypothetical protein V1639_09205 [Pseudarthrobacter sp. J75]|nr:MULTISPECIES: hypothetical protein [unclassified Pseudarthrobacter]MEE2522466.1 hypothetical protein [Pseudarthrobacter sp. J47]MEE2529203.1 hypothetical protein [Pseudarthrobacter sp. J75]
MDEVAEAFCQSSAQLPGRERGRADAEPVDPGAPERLIAKERHNERWPARPDACRGGTCAAMVDDCRNAREEPLVGNTLQDQDVVGLCFAGRYASPPGCDNAAQTVNAQRGQDCFPALVRSHAEAHGAEADIYRWITRCKEVNQPRRRLPPGVGLQEPVAGNVRGRRVVPRDRHDVPAVRVQDVDRTAVRVLQRIRQAACMPQAHLAPEVADHAAIHGSGHPPERVRRTVSPGPEGDATEERHGIGTGGGVERQREGKHAGHAQRLGNVRAGKAFGVVDHHVRAGGLRGSPAFSVELPHG